MASLDYQKYEVAHHYFQLCLKYVADTESLVNSLVMFVREPYDHCSSDIDKMISSLVKEKMDQETLQGFLGQTTIWWYQLTNVLEELLFLDILETRYEEYSRAVARHRRYGGDDEW